MKKKINYWLILITLFMFACSQNDNDIINDTFLELDKVKWWGPTWIIDGEIEGQVLTKAEPSKFIEFWDDERNDYFQTTSIKVTHYLKGTNLPSIQSNIENETRFASYNINYADNSITLRKVENRHLTNTAIVRFISSNEEGKYIIHVNFDGKDYKLKGYPTN